jgi:hypothetical protein
MSKYKDNSLYAPNPQVVWTLFWTINYFSRFFVPL